MPETPALPVAALYHNVDLAGLSFETTADLEPLTSPLGQERALEAIEFGVDIQREGFNLFVMGPNGLGKHRLVKDILEQRAAAEPAPQDWCYINNFDDPQRPSVLKLPAGTGRKLRQDMRQFVEELLTALPASFQNEEYTTRHQEIIDSFNEAQEQAFAQLDQEAQAQGVAVVRTPGGYTLAPIKEDKLLTPEEFEKLPDEEKARIQKVIDTLRVKLRDLVRSLPVLQRENARKIKELQREVTQLTVDQLIAWLEDRYTDFPDVIAYLDRVKQDVIENAQSFMPADGNIEPETAHRRVEEYHEYAINVLVDNSHTQGAPIVYENNPTYMNLTGRVEHIAQMGTLLTDFTLIKAGALHRANGGYLILDAHKVLSNVYAWEGLKRALAAHELKIESLEQVLSLVSTLSLEPESVPLNVKVVLMGEPLLYYLLRSYDPEFGSLFKVEADFSEVAPRDDVNLQLYAQLIASFQQQSQLKPLEKAAVARVIEHASRLAEDGEKVSLHLETLNDLLREADYWAAKQNQRLIRTQDVDQAIEKRIFRSDRIRELVHEQIIRDIQVIATTGEKAGQINGLSVLQLGNFSFGRPSRITATARLGNGKVIDIEREARLGGKIYSKGIMIMAAYLASRYAADGPLPLAATLVFEQSYGRVDGDSATAAELCVLLSALANLPLNQSLAVTGSMNQQGEIQAIGGVNEKIEGFFDICQAKGLNGQQGVIIPSSNQVHLMLRQDVRDAVAAGQFHVYTATVVDDVMEQLCGLPRGTPDAQGRYPEDSFNGRLQRRIDTLRSLHRKYAREAHADLDTPQEQITHDADDS